MKLLLPKNMPKLESKTLRDIFNQGENYGKTFYAVNSTNDCKAGDLFVIARNGCIHVFEDSNVYVYGDDWVYSEGSEVTVEPVAVNCVLDFQAV